MQPNQSHILYCTSSFVKGKSHLGGRNMLNVLLGGCTPFVDRQHSSVWWLLQTAGSDPSWGVSDGRDDSAACPCFRQRVTAQP